MINRRQAGMALAGLALAACEKKTETGVSAPMNTPAGIKKESWGQLPDGRAVDLYTLTNGKGMEARIINWGGIVVSLKVPERAARRWTSCSASTRFDPYIKNPAYFGALIGRYGNRIATCEVQARRRRVSRAEERRRQLAARRHQGLRQELWTAAKRRPGTVWN